MARSTALSDDFTGTNGDPWSATKWQALQGTLSGSTSDIQSNSGRLQTTGGGYVGIARRSLLARGKDVDALFKLTFPTSAEWFVGLLVRATGWATGANPTDGYLFEMRSGAFWLHRRVANSATGVQSAAFTTTGVAWIRVNVSGSVLRAWAWADGGSEPGTPTLDYTDATPVDTSGEVGFQLFGGNAATTAAAYIDDFSATVTPVPAFVQALGTATANAQAATTTVSVTATDKPEVGDFVLAYCSRDNITNDPATGDSFGDGNGNTYTVIARASPAATSTGRAGIVGVFAYSKITTAWPAGTNTFTWTHPNDANNVARAIRVEHWASLDSLRASTSNTAGSTAGAPSVATGATNPSSGDLVPAMAAFENSGSQTETADSDTTNGSWSPITRLFTGSSTNATTALTHAKVVTQYKIVTATGAQTYNVTNSNTTNVDAVAIIAAFAPQAVDVVARPGPGRYLFMPAVQRAAVW